KRTAQRKPRLRKRTTSSCVMWTSVSTSAAPSGSGLCGKEERVTAWSPRWRDRPSRDRLLAPLNVDGREASLPPATDGVGQRRAGDAQRRERTAPRDRHHEAPQGAVLAVPHGAAHEL